MPKLYVISDIHSHYDEMKQALDDVGFDSRNKNHWLIVCGDVWDRSNQSLEVWHYLRELPRKILIKGNHESLFQECCERGYPNVYDHSNGTFNTICQIGGLKYGRSFDECCIVAEQCTKDFLNSFVDYFETENYVFVHGWLPVNCEDNLPAYYIKNRKFSKMENWREATYQQWEDARWLNSFDMVQEGFGIDKCVIAGHWHSSYGRYMTEGAPEFGEGADFSPFHYDNKLIMIDACTAYSGKVNVLVLEDNFLE